MDGRSYSVHFSPKGGKFAKKYPALAHLPYILDSRPGYHRAGNAYLIDRGLGRWRPGFQGEPFSGKIPTQKSMRSYAAWLANFLEWADVRTIDLQTCDYAIHVAGRYQTEMLKGLWSSTGEGLSPGTVNVRVQQACDFLNWMMHTGRRKAAFRVPFTTVRLNIGSATSSVGHLAKEVHVRQGKVRKKEHALVMPADVQVSQWLERIREKKGQTIWLMCYTVLLTAMRREEIVCLRTDTLPQDPVQWKVVNPLAPEQHRNVSITIKYGTKGPQYGEDHDDKVGPSRDILIPLTLAKLWHDYRDRERAYAFGKWMRSIKGQSARDARAKRAVHLFLRDSDGVRFTGEMLGKAWGGVESPFGTGGPQERLQQWSPHSGRHWWACSTLWRELKKHDNIPKPTNETVVALMENTALSIIRLQIQPQLGHSSKETTMLYLRWVTNMISVPLSLYDEEDGD